MRTELLMWDLRFTQRLLLRMPSAEPWWCVGLVGTNASQDSMASTFRAGEKQQILSTLKTKAIVPSELQFS
jgi:hypothetical protein